jgi:hypothetical protein
MTQKFRIQGVQGIVWKERHRLRWSGRHTSICGKGSTQERALRCMGLGQGALMP